MRNYVVQRLLFSIPTLLGVTLLIFFVLRILPGDPIQVMFSGDSGIVHVLTDEQLAAAKKTLGLDRPLWLQYLGWLHDIATGDLGRSFWRGTPLSDVILRRGPISAQIGLVAVAISWMVGLPIGILSAVKRNSISDYSSRVGVILFLAIPSFAIGVTFIILSVILFSWRPPVEIVYLWDQPLKNIQLTVFPALTLGFPLAAVIARMSRATVLEVLDEEYVRMARAKGVRETAVLWRHVLRNALLPVVTVSGLQLAGLLGGTVAVERAFNVPGLGTALVESIVERDWAFIQNLVLLYATIYVIVNLVVDLSYAWIDPRIRYR